MRVWEAWCLPGLNSEAKPKSISLNVSQGLLLSDRSMMLSGVKSRWQKLLRQCRSSSVCTAMTHFNLLMFGSHIHSTTSGPPASIHAAEANTLPQEGPRLLLAMTHFSRLRHTMAVQHADCKYRLLEQAKGFQDTQVTGKPRKPQLQPGLVHSLYTYVHQLRGYG